VVVDGISMKKLNAYEYEKPLTTGQKITVYTKKYFHIILKRIMIYNCIKNKYIGTY